jgi:hypothetical protein
MKNLFFIFLFFIAFAGCGEDTIWLTKLENRLTWDEALLNWGEPTKVIKGENNFVAEWDRSVELSGLTAGFSQYRNLRLTFDNTTKTMTGWKCKNCGYYK